MRTQDFDYDLPPSLIAQRPLPRREAARMLVLHRRAQRWEHRRFTDLPAYLHPGDVLVLNDTKVIPARLFGQKEKSGGKVEILLVEEREGQVWDALLRASRRPKPGTTLVLADGEARAEVLESGARGRATLRIRSDRPFEEILARWGQPPLPPYIRRSDAAPDEIDLHRKRYQTVYARAPGAIAAPTAGLHFTEFMLRTLNERGIRHVTITLHVGPGTFRPVEVPAVEGHEMESERYTISPETVSAIEETKDRGGRVVAVGSTTVRALEGVMVEQDRLVPGQGRTNLFIYPPYSFQVVDAMLTNFHLPRSTLLMMVCALAGRELVLEAYREAVSRRYRFFSYGDCMLIV